MCMVCFWGGALCAYVCYLLVRLLQSKAAAEVLPLAEGLATDTREHAQVIDLRA